MRMQKGAGNKINDNRHVRQSFNLIQGKVPLPNLSSAVVGDTVRTIPFPQIGAMTIHQINFSSSFN